MDATKTGAFIRALRLAQGMTQRWRRCAQPPQGRAEPKRPGWRQYEKDQVLYLSRVRQRDHDDGLFTFKS